MIGPEDFPVAWDSPEESQFLWTRDDVHYPRPASSMTASLLPITLGAGISSAADEFRMAFELRLKVINGWVYNAAVPMVSRSQLAERAREHRVRMRRAIVELPELWQTSYQPELERDIAYLKAFDLRAASLAGFREHLERTLEINSRHWRTHMLTVFPVFAAGAMVSEFCRGVLKVSHESAPYRLLQGLENKTLEVDESFLRLVDRARGSQEVSGILLQSTSGEIGAVEAELSRMSEGREFLQRFREFLEESGYRSTAADEISDVTWREEPWLVLEMLRAALSTEARDPGTIRGSLIAEREAMEEAVRQAIAGDAERLHEFDVLLREARAVWPLRETHSFYIDQTSQALLRYVLLEGGRRLAGNGALNDASDVFYLTIDDLRAALRQPRASVKELIEARRIEGERWGAIEPPAALGSVPQPGSVRPDAQALRYLDRTGIKEKAEGRVLVGVPASAGRASGCARIVMSSADVAKVRPGDVLVCPTTTPPWTPLFAIIGGLVTDAGSVLSHGATIAREYRLPAVVGTRVATREIRDGQRLEVDGTRGEVRFLE